MTDLATEANYVPEAKKRNIAFIGAGNMAGAIICGLLRERVLAPDEMFIYDSDAEKYPPYVEKGVRVCDSMFEAAEQASYIFLGLEPAVVAGVVRELAKIEGLLGRVVLVSIAAAVSTEQICRAAGRAVPVIRTMPSTPMLVGEGAVAACCNALVSKKDFEYVCRLFSALATVSVLDESMMNAVISVNGSSPAYVYLFVKALLDGAAEQGIPEDKALPLILRTVEGGVKMIRQADCSIDTLIARVTSPNGTTLAALASLEHDDFYGAVGGAMHACTERAEEISRELE